MKNATMESGGTAAGETTKNPVPEWRPCEKCVRGENFFNKFALALITGESALHLRPA